MRRLATFRYCRAALAAHQTLSFHFLGAVISCVTGRCVLAGEDSLWLRLGGASRRNCCASAAQTIKRSLARALNYLLFRAVGRRATCIQCFSQAGEGHARSLNTPLAAGHASSVNIASPPHEPIHKRSAFAVSTDQPIKTGLAQLIPGGWRRDSLPDIGACHAWTRSTATFVKR